ncbi:hypothetical protein SUDANB105_07661 [Streptomyces sp. enrichment culture]|uniref:hypothetical protein n=1 Tax=Streptomyces sp. enrichment culture TaxID=1795815 RepID=UPI003F54E3C3
MSIATRLYIDGGDLVVRLPWRWALAARRRSVRLPPEFGDEVRVEPHWWRAVRPPPGRRCRFRPGRWCVGELEHARGRDFAALRARGPVLVVTTFGRDAYIRLAVSTPDPAADVAWPRQVVAQNSSKNLSRQLSTFPRSATSEGERIGRGKHVKVNLARIDAWLSGTSPARTRVSHFAVLQQSEG